MGNLLVYEALGERFRTRHPDLAGRLQVPHSHPLHLSVPLTGGQSVVLAQLRFAKPHDYTPVWAIAGPKISEPPRIWYSTTGMDVLVDALHARAVAELERDEEQTPWKWDEPAAGEIVALADDLAARGADVLVAVAQNRCRAVEAERGAKAEYFERDQGDFVVVQGLGCLVRVSRKPLSGWSASVRADGGGVWQRLDLGDLLFGEPSVVPGVESDHVDRATLAGLVADLARLSRVPTAEDRALGRDGLPAHRSQAVLIESAARELARMGFADVVTDVTCSRLESKTFHIEWWNRSKSMGLGDVQRLYGAAAVEGRRLLVLSDSSATKPACTFADQAKAFVFTVDPEGRRLHSCNDLAREVVLDESSWSPARGLLDGLLR
ncbi:hypothetical protein [Kitasatospora sp. CB01950]|uniref:hypothetical protein n=1 Tax=Kitasatospora sp. CB01950 TaxID=1703930 RepID=UPI00116101C8|nr:hypothetical protein [Kitasatospora sp. CB01950]